MTPTTGPVGRPVSRVDGRQKVTGAAKYAAEHNVPGLLHGYVVLSTIARGRITSIDTGAALAVPGVVQVFTHENRPELPDSAGAYKDEDAPGGSPFRPLYDAEVQYSLQPVALVVAESWELARWAARLVRVEYAATTHETDVAAGRARARHPDPDKSGYKTPPDPWGDPDRALQKAAVRVDAEYSFPVEHHNPMEPHATTAVHEADGSLTVYDKTQGVMNSRQYLLNVFGIPEDKLRVLSPFVGGAFGSGLRPQYQLFLAVMAARELKRSVRVNLTRPEMFSFGHRPRTLQHIALGLAADGTLETVIHEAVAETSRWEDYIEVVVNWSGMLYRSDNARFDHRVVPLDLYTPLDMRAPGAAWGVNALEMAIDEAAYAVGMDPLAFRLKNYAERDRTQDLPYSSKELRACYERGAAKFGWDRRDPAPRSMRDGNHLIGWGLATGIWEAQQQDAAARAVLTADGRLTVGSATADIGTGTYTIMTQIAADALGLPLEAVTFRLGDTTLPEAPLEGGSFTAATVGTAVRAVCDRVRRRLFELAREAPGSPLAAASYEDVVFAGGQVRAAADPSRGVSIADTLRAAGLDSIDEQIAEPPHPPDQKKYTRCAHTAIFAEVRVDADLGTATVTRVVNAVAAGRILNPKTARSQILGGVVWGIGMALEEESLLDHRLGRFMNHDLAEYHVPVCADVHEIDVVFVEEEDQFVNPLGVKGIGEIGVVGTAAAVANAIFHATGKRVRDWPITPDKLL